MNYRYRRLQKFLVPRNHVQSCGNPKIITNYHSKSPSTPPTRPSACENDAGYYLTCCDGDARLARWDTCSTTTTTCIFGTLISEEINTFKGIYLYPWNFGCWMYICPLEIICWWFIFGLMINECWRAPAMDLKLFRIGLAGLTARLKLAKIIPKLADDFKFHRNSSPHGGQNLHPVVYLLMALQGCSKRNSQNSCFQAAFPSLALISPPKLWQQQVDVKLVSNILQWQNLPSRFN